MGPRATFKASMSPQQVEESKMLWFQVTFLLSSVQHNPRTNPVTTSHILKVLFDATSMSTLQWPNLLQEQLLAPSKLIRAKALG